MIPPAVPQGEEEPEYPNADEWLSDPSDTVNPVIPANWKEAEYRLAMAENRKPSWWTDEQWAQKCSDMYVKTGKPWPPAGGSDNFTHAEEHLASRLTLRPTPGELEDASNLILRLLGDLRQARVRCDQQERERAVLIAVALATHGTENEAGNAVSDDIWTEAHERGLIETIRDETGDGLTRSTMTGEAFLAASLVEAEGGSDA